AEIASVPILLFNSERSNFLPVMYVSGGSIFCNTTSAAGDKLFDYTPGEWYDFNIFVDATNRQYRVTKTDSAGNSETSSWYGFDGFKFNDASLNNVGSVNFQIWDHKDDAAYFDNLKIYYDEASPVLTNKSVSFLDKNGSGTVLSDNIVATETKEIRLDFGVGMDNWFFDSDHVKLINNATGAETAWDSSVSGNCAIITLTEPLRAETSYTLSVSGEVDSLARVPLGKDFSFDFTTAEGYTDGSAVLNGDAITASLTNTTDEAKNYMIAYAQYSGERMTQIAVKNITVPSNVMDEEFTFDISSYIGTGYDRADVFLWETDTFSQGVEKEDVRIVQDYENDRLSVSGITESDTALTFMLLNKDKEFSDIPNEGAATEIVQYADVITADDAGNYSLNFQVQPVTGDYTYYIGKKGEDTITGTVHFIASSDIERALGDLINKDAASTAKVLEDNKNVLGFDTALYEKLNKEQTAKLVYSLKQDGRLSADDINTSVALISAAIEAEAIAEGKLSSIGNGLCAVLDSRAAKWCESELFTDKVEKLMVDGCRGTYGSISEFDKTFCEKLVMAIVQNPNGWGNVKAIINDFAKEIGITPSSVYDSTYTKIAGNTYSSYTALKSAVYSANTSSSGSNGGSSSTSGGKSSSSGAAFLGTPQTVIERPSEIKTFDDLSDVEWAREAILKIYNKGIVSGKEESRFYPRDSVTREEFVKMLVLTSGIGETAYRGGFDDVSERDWFAPYVSAAVSNGICRGISGSKFGTGLSISREDMAVMVYNLIVSKNITPINNRTAFEDERDIAGYAADAVAALQQYGIINGRDNNMFAPKDSVTRAEAAMVINAVLDYFE
ncbi:MAG: S-layer homology domain-containing protein, partial [Clostridiales bacterium]|nr:S-layer homology domain-containing protein [Clostridiales bacterium]